MATRKKHLINVHTSTGTTAPTGASIYLGEIAVQHTPNDPALWIKMGTAETSTQYEKFIGKTEITNMVSTASGLVEDLSAVTLTGVTMNGSPVSVNEHVANLGTVVSAETQLSTATTGTGNVVGSIAVDNHKITSTMFSAASADQISKLSGATTAHTANTTMHVTAAERTRWNNAWTSGVSAYTKVLALSGIVETLSAVVEDNEYVISSSLNDLNSRIDELSGAAPDLSIVYELSAATTAHTANTTVHVTSEERTRWNDAWTSGVSAYTKVLALSGIVGTLSAVVEDNEYVISSSLNDLNSRVNELSGAAPDLSIVYELSAATTAHTANTTMHVTATERTRWNNAWTSGVSAYTKVLALSGIVETLSAAVEDIHVDMILGSGYTYSGIPYVNSATSIADAYSALTNELIKDEKTTSAALNDLNTRLGEKVDELSSSSTDDEYPSAKATYDEIHPKVESTMPSGGLYPNVFYNLGTLTGSVTISFATPFDPSVENEYRFRFSTSSTAPTITWPSSITHWAGNSLDSTMSNPVVGSNGVYEVSVVDGLAIIIVYN